VGQAQHRDKRVHVEGPIETMRMLSAYYRNIADAIHGKAELIVKAEEAMNTIRIIELAIQSSEQQRTLPYSQP